MPNTAQNLLELVEEYRVRVKAMQKPLDSFENSETLPNTDLTNITEVQ